MRRGATQGAGLPTGPPSSSGTGPLGIGPPCPGGPPQAPASRGQALQTEGMGGVGKRRGKENKGSNKSCPSKYIKWLRNDLVVKRRQKKKIPIFAFYHSTSVDFIVNNFKS
jgi:hypothetical protein